MRIVHKLYATFPQRDTAMKTNKEYDTVKAMREIREKLSEKYWKHPDILKQDMEAIRKKYGQKIGGQKS
jgi:hypothetical protein